MSEYNPIRSVDGTAIKCPSYFKWKLQDLSSKEAGRTENGHMDKMRQGQIVGIDLKWQNITTEDAAKILQAFNPQYLSICYLDPKEGSYRTAEFYVGDRSAPLYNSMTGRWSEIAFNIIERNATLVEGDDLSNVQSNG